MASPGGPLIIAEDVKGPGSGFQTREKFVFKDIDMPRGSQNKTDDGRQGELRGAEC